MAKGPRKWTIEALKASAKKYESVKTWRTQEPSAYATASQQNLLPELTAHMSKKIIHGYWTKERIIDSAKGFSQISEWAKAQNSAYHAAFRLGVHKKATSHMIPVGNKKRRCVYVITVEKAKLAYVGLTGNLKRREADHLKTKRFVNLANQYGQDSIVCIKVSEYIASEDAQALENQTAKDFQQKGYRLLNRAKTGGLGGIDRKWTDKAIYKEAAKYDLLKEWRENSPSSYSAAGKKGIIRKASAHQKRLLEEKWDEQAILENARQFKHKVRWKERYPGAVLAARRLNIFKRATAHMVPLSERNKWTRSAIISDAKKYQSKSEWHRDSVGGYEAALRNNFISEATRHMENKKVHEWTEELLIKERAKFVDFDDWKTKAPSSFLAARKLGLFGLKPPVPKNKKTHKWSKEAVVRSAQKYHHKSKWKKAEGGAYSAAVKKGWYAEATAHMEILNPLGKWDNKVAIIEEAKKYQTKSGWQDGSVGSYEAAKRLSCFEEAIQHMTVLRKKWTRNEILDVASQFNTISEWRTNNSSSYAAARRLKIMDQATIHMDILNPIGAWAEKDTVLSDAKKYFTRTSWYKNSAGAYASAKRNDWFEEAVKHMPNPKVKDSK